MLHPNQFVVNEAWIAFWLNDEPLHTVQDGSFNCICLMDAASCFILGNAMIPAQEPEPSEPEAVHLFSLARARGNVLPKTLLVPHGQFPTALTAVAQGEGIEVVPVDEDQLYVFIGEARQGFREHVQGGNREA